MRALFNPDSKFMQAMSRMSDLFMLNIYFLITSLPIFTIGASLTALYSVVFRFDTLRETGTTRSYFRAFQSEFKQATLLWIPILVFAIVLCVNLYLFASLGGPYRYANIFFGILLLLDLFVAAYAFPLLSQFNNTNKEILVNSLGLSIAYLPRTALIVLMNLLPLIVFLLNALLFFITALMWALFWFAITAYFSSLLLKKVFAPFMPEEEETEGSK